MLSLDEAIAHCLEVAEKNEKECKWISGSEDAGMNGALAKTYAECAKEHRQLAEWLRKLKAYEEAREEIIRKMNSGQWSDAVMYGMSKALLIINKHIGEVNADE